MPAYGAGLGIYKPCYPQNATLLHIALPCCLSVDKNPSGFKLLPLVHLLPSNPKGAYESQCGCASRSSPLPFQAAKIDTIKAQLKHLIVSDYNFSFLRFGPHFSNTHPQGNAERLA